MRLVSFDKAFKSAFGTILWSLNYLLLMIPIFIVLLSGAISADTLFVTFLSVFLTAFGGIQDLHEENDLSMWLTSQRRLMLHTLAFIFLFIATALAFASAISSSAILSLPYGTYITCFIAVALMALITPYMLVRLSISFQLFLYARDGSMGAPPLIHDYIRPMLRKRRP